jgi:copper chaperone
LTLGKAGALCEHGNTKKGKGVTLSGTSPNARRFGRGLTLRLLILAVALAAGAWGVLRQRAPAPVAGPPLARTEFRIQGMDCLMCAAGLQNKLRALPGVLGAEVSYQERRAVIEFDPARISQERLAQAIKGDGFEVALPGAASRDAAPPSHRH